MRFEDADLNPKLVHLIGPIREKIRLIGNVPEKYWAFNFYMYSHEFTIDHTDKKTCEILRDKLLSNSRLWDT